jgi:hypothetical protein
MSALAIPFQKAPEAYSADISGLPRLFQGVGTCPVIDHQLLNRVDDPETRRYISGIVKDFGRQWDIMSVEAFDAALAPFLDAVAPLEGYTHLPPHIINGHEIRVAVGPVQNKSTQAEITRVLRMLEHMKILAATVEGAMAQVLGQQQNKVSLQIGQLQRQIMALRDNPQKLEPKHLQESVNRIAETVKLLPPAARAAFAEVLKQINTLPQNPLFSPPSIAAPETRMASSPMPREVAAKIEGHPPIHVQPANSNVLSPVAPLVSTVQEPALPQPQAALPASAPIAEASHPLQTEIKIPETKSGFQEISPAGMSAPATETPDPKSQAGFTESLVPQEHKAEAANEISLPAKPETREETPKQETAETRIDAVARAEAPEEVKAIPAQSPAELPGVPETTDIPKALLRSEPDKAEPVKEPEGFEKQHLHEARETRAPETEKEPPKEKASDPPAREEAKERIKAEFRENKEIVCNMGHIGCTINHKLGEDTAPRAETVTGQISFGGEEKKSVQADFQKTATEIVCNMGHVGCTINHKLGEDTAPKAETVTGKINFGGIPAAATAGPPQTQLHRHPT